MKTITNGLANKIILCWCADTAENSLETPKERLNQKNVKKLLRIQITKKYKI